MSDKAGGLAPRYHALDCVRATAMLLGVVYHAIQVVMYGGGLGYAGSPFSLFVSVAIRKWLHSFRMPLFFMISGFFCHMMLGKYGTGLYLKKRWWRIGAPMVVALFALALVHAVIRSRTAADFAGGSRRPSDQQAGETWATAAPPSVGLNPPEKAGTGLPGESASEGSTAVGAESAGDGTAAAGDSPSLTGGGSMEAEPIQLGREVGPLARWLFGRRADQFRLGALWFLWYLLLFATVAPFVTRGLATLFLRPTPEAADRLGRWSIRYAIAPLLLGLLSVPALMQTRSPYGWSLGMPDGFSVTFPDIVYQYQADMPFYFVYFLSGWWLYRLRDSLPDVARSWLPSLVVGSVAFVLAGAISAGFEAQTRLSYYSLIRAGGYALSAVGSAYVAWGFLGFFQRYVNRPTRAGRYLADTAFWVYLVHQELLKTAVHWIAPLNLPWWAQALAASVLATAAGLALFEIVVRPTPLNSLFGTGSLGRLAAYRSARSRRPS